MLVSWLDLRDQIAAGTANKVQRELWRANAALAMREEDLTFFLNSLPPAGKKECRQMLRSTHEVREFLRATLGGMQDGTLSTSMARTRILLARAVIDTIKVELVAANLGKPVRIVNFDTPKLQAAE